MGQAVQNRQKEIRNGRWETLEVMALLLGCYMLDYYSTYLLHRAGTQSRLGSRNTNCLCSKSIQNRRKGPREGLQGFYHVPRYQCTWMSCGNGVSLDYV